MLKKSGFLDLPRAVLLDFPIIFMYLPRVSRSKNFEEGGFKFLFFWMT
jgi:hypothetical protein